jgi:phosphonate transport system substrate-binding protein
VAVAGCLGGGDDDAIDFVLNPAEESVDIEAQYQPLFTQIEDEFDVEMNGVKTASYAGTVEEIEAAGDGDRLYADTSPSAVPRLGDSADVVGLRVAFGAEKYFSLMVTRPETGIESLSDLEGEDVTTQNVSSLSGGIAPFWMLQENGGLDIGDAPDGGSAGDFNWVQADAHDTAVNSLINGDVVAAGAGAFVTVEHVPEDQILDAENGQELANISPEFADAGTADEELQLLKISPSLPRAPILANSGWDDNMRQDIDEFMLNADPEQFQHDGFELADELGHDYPDELLEDYNSGEVAEDPENAYDLSDEQVDNWDAFQQNELWFSGVTEGTAEDYEPINDFANDIGLDLSSVS